MSNIRQAMKPDLHAAYHAANNDDIRFYIPAEGPPLIMVAGDLVNEYEFTGMYDDAQKRHTASKHSGIFHLCPSCRQWVMALAMWQGYYRARKTIEAAEVGK